jgi:ABC-2 type transport system permease protein
VAIFAVLLKKELRGNVRTHRVLIVAALFFVLGMATPLLLRYLHVLVPADEAGFVVPEFAAEDAVESYFDTIGQFGLVAAILVAMGSISRERESGTAAMTLSKPVGCGPFLAAKLVAHALVFTSAAVIGAAACLLYTTVLFERVDVWDFVLGNVALVFYLLTCLTVTVMWSAVFKSHLAAGGLALVTMIALIGISAVPGAGEYSPGNLAGWAQDIASGRGHDVWGALGVGAAAIGSAAVAGWQVLKRKEL